MKFIVSAKEVSFDPVALIKAAETASAGRWRGEWLGRNDRGRGGLERDAAEQVRAEIEESAYGRCPFARRDRGARRQAA